MFFKWLFNSELKELQDSVNESKKLNILMNSKIEFLERNFKVAADINQRRSWAVVCLEGETTNLVKFVDLRHRDVREISQFLNQYDISNQIVDFPLHLGQHFHKSKKVRRR